MPLLLYINGKQADLEPSQVIAQTKQVNDLNSIQDRQANFTNKFKLPKTANNLRIMNFLTAKGNTSAVPYTKNECSLYSDNGQCFIYKGRAVITDGGDYFDVVVYDGIIDLYKAIENKNLSQLSLTGLNHTKSVAAVISSWQPTSPYRYILADYNSNIGNLETKEVNVDYLIPSANVKYIWDKIFSEHNCTYSGAVFNTQEFKNLWMTYPKGVSNEQTDELVFESSNFSFPQYQSHQSAYARFNDADTNLLASHFENAHFKVAQAGTYKLSFYGGFNVLTPFNQGPFRIIIAKNSESIAAMHAAPQWYVTDVLNGGSVFERELVVDLQPNQSISIVVQKPSNHNYWWISGGLRFKIIKLNQAVDFKTALEDFSVREFLTEVVHRFGLTMYKEKHDRLDPATGTYKPHYNFLTLQEQLQSSEIVDWSDKFGKKIKEEYIHGSYAQKNFMRYNYNDKEGSYNDGALEVQNKNLQDSRDIIKSKIYSPERKKSQYFTRQSNVYKLWDKEVSEEENEPVKYKPLDKRYYFLRSEQVFVPGGLTLKSSATNQSQLVTTCQFESFYKMTFSNVAFDYYLPLERILNRSLMVSAELYLTDADICNFDFRKLYYIAALGDYFMVNKINNYIPGKPVKCDLVRVLYTDEMPERKVLHINKTITSVAGVAVFYENNTGTDTATLHIQHAVNGQHYTTYLSTNNPTWSSLTPGYFKVYLTAGGYTSNVVYVNHSYSMQQVTQYY
ncbi:hypothetical protein LRS05_13405 [Flavobacterium sp. J372]|uniref:hypothetical protein n=1 Tax=Flavobacterium sp. J372 TaxID=2898436 RepID=UPI002150DE3F|nr:hypothetical protein [Flavobacterium sp. J372]MCR5863061.1 hypothetical protein [Flavobacterium sp. J372]